MDLNKVKNIYFVGIGGKGLNGIAKICIKKNFIVSGSDIKRTAETISIEKLGVTVNYTQIENNINSDIDLIVKTLVVGEDHAEIKEAKRLAIPVLERAEFLKLLVKDYTKVSIAGSHGKSTTTALVGLLLHIAGKDPTIFGGAYIKELDSYERLGNGKYAVFESCEYGRSFYNLIGDYTFITSLEKSHMEYYKTEESMNLAFKTFIEKHNTSSTIFINGDNVKLKVFTSTAKGKVISYGFNSTNDYTIKNTTYFKTHTSFDVYKGDRMIVENLNINIPGSYNVLNFAATVAFLDTLNINKKYIYELGRIFTGVGRRFEVRSSNRDVIFVDDFCHHPTQVKNLMEGIHQFFPNKKVLAVFEPRQFHLMKTFIKEYGKAFSGADRVIVTDIVPALGDTDKDQHSLNVSDVVFSIKNNGGVRDVEYSKSYKDVIKKIIKEGNDLVIATIGAGNIYKIRDMLLKL